MGWETKKMTHVVDENTTLKLEVSGDDWVSSNYFSRVASYSIFSRVVFSTTPAQFELVGVELCF